MEPTELTPATNTSRRGAARRDVPRPESTSSVVSAILDATVIHTAESVGPSFVRVPRN